MSMKCGHCKERHETLAEVRACSARQATPSDGASRAAARLVRALQGVPEVAQGRPAHVVQAVQGQGGTWSQPADEGVYQVGARIFRVVTKAKGSGRAVAEEMINGKYVYAKGWVFRLLASQRMSLEKARAWGRREVRCVRCGTPLEKAESREAGIGPVCATKI